MVTSVDGDTREVIALLGSAVAASGLSQAGFARAMGTSASRLSTYLGGTTRPSAQFVVRARRLGAALDAARGRGLMSAPATAAAMREYMLVGDVEWVWRMLLQGRDHLRLMLTEGEGGKGLLDSWEAEPGSVGAMEWDALLAALTLHEFDQCGLEPPRWSNIEPLVDAWRPEHPFLDAARVQAQTPAWLRALNIYVPQRDLVTA